ncbi:hypothetical protein pb186bvf_003955 [Paramecium bursaria]
MGNCSGCCISMNRDTTASSININELMQRNSLQKQFSNENPISYIQIKATTWNKDSNDLYDYENNSKISQSLTIDQQAILYRQNNNTISTKKLEDSKQLLNIDYNQKIFQILPKQQKSESQVWMVVKSIQQNQGLKLNVNDTIRVGKIEMKLRQLFLEQHRDEFNNRETVLSGTSQSENQCRLCLSNLDCDDNPLITPCKCSGSLQFIHLQCLQQWITTKNNIEVINNSVVVFFWSQMKCELCKSTFNRNIKINGQELDLVEKSKGQFQKYAIFDLKRRDQKSQDLNVTYIIGLDVSSNFKIGRANDNQIKIQDISVSRYHGKICFMNDNLYIYDNSSKFGTLIKLKKSIPLFPELNSVQFQVGRTVFEFESCTHQDQNHPSIHKLF